MSKIYSAGWALQSPILNYFKRFINLNKDLELNGIVYPKKIPNDIEGIPVLDFIDFKRKFNPGDTVIRCQPRNSTDLSKIYDDFFENNQIKSVSLPDFLKNIILNDSQENWKLPFDGISSQDIKSLQDIKSSSIFDGNFLDFKSYDTAKKLHSIFKDCKWNEFIDFDIEENIDSQMLQIIRELHDRGFSRKFHILGAPKFFLDILLSLKTIDPNSDFAIYIPPSCLDAEKLNIDFYKKNLNIVDINEDPQTDAMLLTDSTSSFSMLTSTNSSFSSAAILLSSSLIGYNKIANELKYKKYRSLLRQPDTDSKNLIAGFIFEK